MEREGNATQLVPYSVRLATWLDSIEGQADGLLDASQIEDRRAFNRGGSVVFIAPDWEWAAPTVEVQRLQMQIVPEYDAWVERYQLLFRDAPADLLREVAEATAQIREWLARDGTGWTGWDVPPTIAEARAKVGDRFATLRRLLSVVAPARDMAVIAVPDTSALINAPDLALYASALGMTSIDLCLVAPVLAEVDALKDQGKTADVREKARAVVRSVKLVRQRGSLPDGVDWDGGVRVFSRPQEPRFEGLPGALDPSIPDDRILAVAFELQRDNPSSAVVLVTADVNLQTKAELARLPFAEPPEPPS